jgi:hypothetical protein
LERAPAARYQKVAEILAALTAQSVGRDLSTFRRVNTRAVSLAIVAVMMGLALGYIWRRTVNSTVVVTTNVQASTASLAILPFRNASREHDLEWLGLLLPEMMRAEIGQPPALRIVSQSRVFQILRDLRVSADVELDRTAANRLLDFGNAETMLSGQYTRVYTRTGTAIRIDAAIDGPNHAAPPVVVTADALTEIDIPQAVKTLVRELRANTALKAVSTDTLTTGPVSTSMTALKAYAKGLQLAREGNDLEAVKQFHAATQADPAFALAFAKLAQSYVRLPSEGDAGSAARQAVSTSRQSKHPCSPST